MGAAGTKAYRVVVSALMAGAVAWIVPHLAWVHSHSIRYSLLWVVGGPGGKGDYVTVPVHHPLIRGPYNDHLTKRIGCVEGEVLRFENGGDYCGSYWLGRVLPRAYDGTPLKPFVWNGPIPAGKVFLVGDDPRSFDSRYLGFFNRTETVRLKALL